MSMDEKDLKRLMEEQSAHIEIPDSLKPDQVERVLESRGKKKRNQYYGKIAAVAACGLLVIGVAAVGAGGLGSAGKQDTSPIAMEEIQDAAGAPEEAEGGTSAGQAAAEDTASGKQDQDNGKNEAASGAESQEDLGRKFEVTEIRTAKNYDEIYEYLEEQYRENQKEMESYATADGAAMDSGMIFDESAKMESAPEAAMTDEVAGADMNSTSGYSDTNVREEGVGEADIVKTDGKRLYIVNNQQIQIVDIQKEEMEYLGTIRLDKECYVSEIFVKGDRLVAVYNQSEYLDQSDVDTGEYGGIYRDYAVAETFDISKPEKPKSLGKVSQSGYYNTMRVVGDYVYLLSDFYVEYYGTGSMVSSNYIPMVQGKRIASGDILMPVGSRANKYTIISAFSIKDPEKKIDSKAVFGAGGLCYVSKENIYICESDYGSYGVMPLARQGGGSGQNVSQTCIRKVSYKDGKLKAVGQTTVDGTLNDSFSIDEYDGNLRMVVTVTPLSSDGTGGLALTDEVEEERQKETNALYILDENLEELSRIEGLAENEVVYSARFMGEAGYFVTFRQMDPLFSVDLSDPENPEILGKLKIPGFSEYLHPYGKGKLLGIGMDVDETGTTTEGVKLSMFDISDPANVEEVEKQVLENTYSSSVFYDYKAAFVDVEKNLIGFPTDGDITRYFVFSYGEDGFECLLEREMSGYAWNVRAMYSGSRLYLVAGNTVESYDMKNFKKIDDIVL